MVQTKWGDYNKYCSLPECQRRRKGDTITREQRKAIGQAAYGALPPNHPFRAHGGRTSPKAKRYFSSKGERRLVQQIKTVFPQHHWSTGGRFKIAEGVFKSLDLYCRDLRLIVEYDGAYHWFNIHGNLTSVQQKDRLLETWCQETGWRLIRVNEATYQQRPEVVAEIQRLISEADSLPAVTHLYWVSQTK